VLAPGESKGRGMTLLKKGGRWALWVAQGVALLYLGLIAAQWLQIGAWLGFPSKATIAKAREVQGDERTLEPYIRSGAYRLLRVLVCQELLNYRHEDPAWLRRTLRAYGPNVVDVHDMWRGVDNTVWANSLTGGRFCGATVTETHAWSRFRAVFDSGLSLSLLRRATMIRQACDLKDYARARELADIEDDVRFMTASLTYWIKDWPSSFQLPLVVTADESDGGAAQLDGLTGGEWSRCSGMVLEAQRVSAK